MKRLATRTVLAAFVVVGLCAGSVPASAGDINKGASLNNRSQSKVNNARAKAYLQKDDGSGEKSSDGSLVSRGKTGCGAVSVGSVASGQKAPKDMTVVVTGDVINLGGKCK